MQNNRAVHEAHCFQGENANNCKYGDEDCPVAHEAPQNEFEARMVADGMPTDCCRYGVISHSRGKEVCRVWEEEDARQIADLLNTTTGPESVRILSGNFNELRDAAGMGFNLLKEKLAALDALIKNNSNDEDFILNDDISLNRDDIWALRHRTQDRLMSLSDALNSTYSQPRYSPFSL